MPTAFRPSPLELEPLAREAALGTVALAATLLLAHGQTTERTVVTAERLGHALGAPVRVLPDWDKITVELEGTYLSQIAPTKPLGMDMNRVLAITAVADRLCDGMLRADEARPALLSAGNLPPISALALTSFAAIGAESLGVRARSFQNRKEDQTMRIKTLHRILTDGGSVRLVQRETSKPFAIIIDVPHQHVAFETYAQFAEAAACFSWLSGQMSPQRLNRAVS